LCSLKPFSWWFRYHICWREDRLKSSCRGSYCLCRISCTAHRAQMAWLRLWIEWWCPWNQRTILCLIFRKKNQKIKKFVVVFGAIIPIYLSHSLCSLTLLAHHIWNSQTLCASSWATRNSLSPLSQSHCRIHRNLSYHHRLYPKMKITHLTNPYWTLTSIPKRTSTRITS